MELYPTFPTCREDTPKRQAEKQIYEAFKSCDFDGRVLYEVRPLHTAPQLDFAVWIVGVGIFGIQTKGGRYIIIDGEWYLVTDQGRIRKESPIPGTWDAAMAIRDVVQEMFHQSIFVIPVLAMPNMEPNEEIEALAGSRNVAMHWGDPSQIVDHLVQLAIDRKVYITPHAGQHRRPGAAGRARAGATAPGSGRTGIPAGAPHPRRALAHPHPPGPVGTAGDGGLAPSSARWTWSRTAARTTTTWATPGWSIVWSWWRTEPDTHRGQVLVTVADTIKLFWYGLCVHKDSR